MNLREQVSISPAGACGARTAATRMVGLFLPVLSGLFLVAVSSTIATAQRTARRVVHESFMLSIDWDTSDGLRVQGESPVFQTVSVAIDVPADAFIPESGEGCFVCGRSQSGEGVIQYVAAEGGLSAPASSRYEAPGTDFVGVGYDSTNAVLYVLESGAQVALRAASHRLGDPMPQVFSVLPGLDLTGFDLSNMAIAGVRPDGGVVFGTHDRGCVSPVLDRWVARPDGASWTLDFLPGSHPRGPRVLQHLVPGSSTVLVGGPPGEAIEFVEVDVCGGSENPLGSAIAAQDGQVLLDLSEPLAIGRVYSARNSFFDAGSLQRRAAFVRRGDPESNHGLTVRSMSEGRALLFHRGNFDFRMTASLEFDSDDGVEWTATLAVGGASHVTTVNGRPFLASPYTFQQSVVRRSGGTQAYVLVDLPVPVDAEGGSEVYFQWWFQSSSGIVLSEINGLGVLKCSPTSGVAATAASAAEPRSPGRADERRLLEPSRWARGLGCTELTVQALDGIREGL